MTFQANLQIIHEGGTITTTNQGLSVQQADNVTLLLAAATDYWKKDPQTLCIKHLEQASKKHYSELYQSFILNLYNLVSLKVYVTTSYTFP